MEREPNTDFRRATRTRNPHVKLYQFVRRDIDIPSDPEERDWAADLLRYAELQEAVEKSKKRKKTPGQETIEEKQQLGRLLEPYLRERLRQHRKSVLKGSWRVPRLPHESGKDSYVYYTGTKEEFLARPDTPRYVTKYSVPSREVTPENIEYLKKKYLVLKKLMRRHIPRSGFIFGEFRNGIPKHMLGSFFSQLRAITIQREIRGKTFAEMTPEERSSPRVVRALMESVYAYCTARDILREACLEAGVRPKTFELSLDIGEINCDELETHFNPSNYSSPNVMYDEQKNRVFFIDMGWGKWSAKQEKVYRKIMRRSEGAHSAAA